MLCEVTSAKYAILYEVTSAKHAVLYEVKSAKNAVLYEVTSAKHGVLYEVTSAKYAVLYEVISAKHAWVSLEKIWMGGKWADWRKKNRSNTFVLTAFISFGLFNVYLPIAIGVFLGGSSWSMHSLPFAGGCVSFFFFF
jgi:hypothetical protein